MNSISDPSTGPNQHEIPRHYLRGFADSPGRTHIWVYTKGQPYSIGNEVNKRRNPLRQAIRSAGARHGTYRLVGVTGEQLDADRVITKQETFGIEVLRKLRDREPISVDDKIRFSIYIDLTRARVAAGRKHALPFVMKAIQSSFDLDRLLRKAAEEGRFALARKFDSRFPQNLDAIARELHLRGMVVRSQAIARQLAMMRWIFYTVDGDRFFPTTDNPAFFPPGLGLKQDNGFTVMPIDTQMILVVSNLMVDDRQYVPATPEQYTLWRNVILAGATERAFACRNDPAILGMLDSPQLPPPRSSPSPTQQ
jgi:hypothetical protein